LDTPEHADSENIKLKIGYGSFIYQLFSKRDFYFLNVAKIGKNGPKMEFFDFFENCICSKKFSNEFYDLKNVKIVEIF
jgi:hypothetical protein